MITKEEMLKDQETLENLFHKYSNNIIWEGQTPNPYHFDRQPKLAQVSLLDIRSGLFIAKSGIEMALEAVNFPKSEEDEKKF